MPYYIHLGDDWSYAVLDTPPRDTRDRKPFDTEVEAHLEMCVAMTDERERINKALRYARKKIASLY